MENLSTVIICIIIAAICVYSIFSYMKRLKNGCCGGSCEEIKIKPSDTDISHYPYKVTVFIDGMTCNGCKTRVENAFNCMDGTYAKVNLKKKYAEIWLKTEPKENVLKANVEKLGYEYVKCE